MTGGIKAKRLVRDASNIGDMLTTLGITLLLVKIESMTTKSRSKDRVLWNSGKAVCHFAHTFDVNIDISAGKGEEPHSVGICLIGQCGEALSRASPQVFEHFQAPEERKKCICNGCKPRFKRREMLGLCP